MPAKKPWYESSAITILMLIFVAPLGVALMWLFQKSWSLQSKAAVSVISLCFFGYFALNNSKNETKTQMPIKVAAVATPKEEQKKTPLVVEAPTNKPVPETTRITPAISSVPAKLSDEDKMKKVIQDYFGKRLRTMLINKSSKKEGRGEGLDIYVEFNQSGWATWSMSSNTAKKQINLDMRDAYFKIYTAGIPVDKVSLANYSNLMDQYGKETQDISYQTTLDKDVDQKINWQNRAILNWDDLWETNLLNRSFRDKS